jgi:hypothetical protein
MSDSVSVFSGTGMTFRRLLLVACLSAGVGCAALPSGDSTPCLNASSNGGDCGFWLPDGSTDAIAVPWEGGATDAGAGSLARSALCGGDCNPEDALACVGDGGLDAATVPDDAGAQSCRVVLGAGQQTSSACGKAGLGADGASCTSGSDCAPGFECVGTGTCRHYCCHDDECATLTTQSNGSSTYFCDIATEHAASGAIVPVCDVVQTCMPFSAQCGTEQACTIVELDPKNFVTTCDAVGPGKLGDSCETQRCAIGYACIGTTGARTCQQLCDNAHLCSGYAATCNTQSPALPKQLAGTSVGICSQ